MKWLCKIGLHRWKATEWVTSLVMPFGVEQCSRCGCGRERDFYATFHYTPEQMADAARLARGESHD